MEEEQQQEEQSSRFQVDRVDVGNGDVDIDMGGADDGGGADDDDNASLGQYTYVYDTRYAKSMGQLTREALPRAENYKDILSFGEHRPTLDELHEGQFREKVRQKLIHVRADIQSFASQNAYFFCNDDDNIRVWFVIF
jgi:hypothetical protein